MKWQAVPGLGPRLAEAREAAGFDKGQMGLIVHCARHTLRRWEQEEISPNVWALVEWAKACDVSILWLLGVKAEDEAALKVPIPLPKDKSALPMVENKERALVPQSKRQWSEEIDEIVSYESRERIILKAAEQAEEGNRFAREFLYDRVDGAPARTLRTERANPTVARLFQRWEIGDQAEEKEALIAEGPGAEQLLDSIVLSKEVVDIGPDVSGA